MRLPGNGTSQVQRQYTFFFEDGVKTYSIDDVNFIKENYGSQELSNPLSLQTGSIRNVVISGDN